MSMAGMSRMLRLIDQQRRQIEQLVSVTEVMQHQIDELKKKVEKIEDDG